ncbi:MAG: N-acetylmuramoyl-L-alanine amidase family protein [Luteolibacter sp.]|jgi:N-acetylmuramoyl-L-alanine amidase
MASSASLPLCILRALARRSWLKCALLFALITQPVAANPNGWGWETKKIDGRDHVSADSIMRFYNFKNVSRSGKMHILESPDRPRVEVKLEIGGHTCLMNNVKFVFSHPIIEEDGKVWVSRVDLSKLIDPVLRPSYIPHAGDFNTVILDPGHGGKDPGAKNSLGTEAFYNLKLSGLAKRKLEARGFRVVMTRSSDRFLSLQERVDFANSVKESAVFISIHFNAGGSHARGIETFTLSPPGVSHYGRGLRADDFRARAGNQQDSANIALATALHGSALTRLGQNTFDRGIKRARFNVLSGVRHPAVLFEGGFMSHPHEARLIHNERYQDALATSIADAVIRYRAAVSRNPNAAAHPHRAR